MRALAGTGIQASDLVGQTIGNNGISFGGLGGEIAVPPFQAVRTTFSFAVTRPADALKSMVDKLEALRRQPPTGFSVQYGAALAPSANAVEELRRTVLPQLITEARRKAQNVASAANLTLGAIESIGDVGIGSVGIYAAGRVLSVSSEFRSTFAITVRFAAR